MVHLLSAEPNIPSHYFFCFGEEVVDGSAEPALMAIDADGLHAGLERIRQAVVNRRARKLDSTGENDEFDLVEGELSERFGGSESLVSHRDEIRHDAGANVPFSIAETKNVCRSGCDHLVKRIGSEADFVASEVDLVEQIAGGGEGGVAAQDDG